MLNRGFLISCVLYVRRALRSFAKAPAPVADPFDLAWCSDIGRFVREVQ